MVWYCMASHASKDKKSCNLEFRIINLPIWPGEEYYLQASIEARVKKLANFAVGWSKINNSNKNYMKNLLIILRTCVDPYYEPT